MKRYTVSIHDVDITPAAKSETGFTKMDIRFLITNKTVGSKKLSLFRTVFPPGYAAHEKHYHKDIEEVMFGIRGRGVVGMEHEDGTIEEYEVSPGVGILVPDNKIHWFRTLDPNEEVEICGVYSVPNAGEYRPEDYIYMGKITEKDKKLKP